LCKQLFELGREIVQVRKMKKSDIPSYVGISALGLSRQLSRTGAASCRAFCDAQRSQAAVAARKELGLELKAHPHMLRHACGYALANKGHDTRAIQGWLGHRSITSTAVYTALAPNRFKDFWRE
jgi:site-specific recombinase XerD